MNNLKRLTTTFSDIEHLVIQILQKGVELGKTIKADTISVSTKTDCSDKEYISDIFKMKIMEMISDAENIKNELDKFISALSQNSVEECDCHFLLQIWQGDTYGKSGIDALEELKKDLKIQYDKMTQKNLVLHVMNVIKNDTSVIASRYQ